MPQDGNVALSAYKAGKEATKAEPSQAPLGMIDSVEAILAKSRAGAEEVRAGIYAVILTSATGAAALSMIPLTSSFASHYAGEVFAALARPAISGAISNPLSDYLDNIFPTRELGAMQLLRGMERGALTDEEIIDTGIDAGFKDKEIRKLVKIGKVLRFEKETEQDYAMLDRYQDALISAQLAAARAEVDEGIAAREAEIKEWQRIAREQAAKELAP